MKKIVDRFDKHLIADLPRASFPGKICVVVSEPEAERAVEYLLSQPIIGLDTETRPSFTRGSQYKVALLQVSSHDVCFLFRLNQMGLPQCLIRLLSDNTITKVGLSWHDDLRMLHRRKRFREGTFVELQEMSKTMGIVDMSLQKLYANIFSQKISKTQQLSNWEADSLSESQQLYAATDAWACIQLYEEMMRMQEEGFELECIPMPEPPVQATPESDAPAGKKKRKSPKGEKAPAPPEPPLTPEEQAAREARRRKRQERREHFRQLARERREAAKANKALKKLAETESHDKDHHTEEG